MLSTWPDASRPGADVAQAVVPALRREVQRNDDNLFLIIAKSVSNSDFSPYLDETPRKIRCRTRDRRSGGFFPMISCTFAGRPVREIRKIPVSKKKVR
jgi:hypothetical protein